MAIVAATCAAHKAACPVGAIPVQTGECGQSLVELALVLPILLLIVTGMLSFGVTLNTYLLLGNASSVGAQQLAISRGQTLDPCATAVAAVYRAAPALDRNSLGFKLVMNGTTYTATSCPGSSTTSGPAAQLAQGSPVQLSLTYPCNLGVFRLSLGFCSVLTAETTEMVE